MRFSEKATKFDEISIVVLALLSNVKNKIEFSSNFLAFTKYMNFTYKNRLSISYDLSQNKRFGKD